MANPVQLEVSELPYLVLELSGWNPIPYPLLCLAKHGQECSIGMEFYVDKWPSCSVAVAIPSFECDFPFLEKAIFLDARNDEKLPDVLSHIPIDWTHEYYFSAIHQRLRSICETISAEYGTLYGDIPEHTMVQKSAGNSMPDTILPDGYRIAKLENSDASTIMNKWKFTGDFSKESVQHRVEHSIMYHPTVAIRDREEKLIAYELTSPHGTMGMLHVEPDNRGRGLATTIVAELSKELCNEEHPRYCHVSAANPASIKLHEKCGFVIEEGADIVWTFFKPK